jgi:hypothetical protein
VDGEAFFIASANVPSGLVKSGWALGFDASTMIPYYLLVNHHRFYPGQEGAGGYLGAAANDLVRYNQSVNYLMQTSNLSNHLAHE